MREEFKISLINEERGVDYRRSSMIIEERGVEDVYRMKLKLEGAGISFISVTLAMLKAGSGELHKGTSVKQDSVEGIPHDVVDLGGLVLEGLGDLVPEDPAKLILMQLGELSIRW